VEGREQIKEAALQLYRVGLDRVAAYLDGGMLAWAASSLPIGRVPVISPEQAHELLKSRKATLIDVRSVEEKTAVHVEGSIDIPWHDLRARYSELDPQNRYILMCKGGQRASIAASILKMRGFSRICNLAGGFLAYQRAGFIS